MILYISTSATNKKYVDTENIRQDIAIADKADKSYVDVEIAKVHIDTKPLLPRDGSRSMTSDLHMDNNHILSVKNLNDYKVDDAYEVRVRDLGSAVNKEYLNEKFLKVDRDGNYFDLKQNTIKNCEPYYDGLFDDNSLVSKAFVDAEISKLPKPATDVLKLDGSKAMTGDFDVGGFGIKDIKPFVEDDSSQAAFDAQKNDVSISCSPNMAQPLCEILPKVDHKKDKYTLPYSLIRCEFENYNPSYIISEDNIFKVTTHNVTAQLCRSL